MTKMQVGILCGLALIAMVVFVCLGTLVVWPTAWSLGSTAQPPITITAAPPATIAFAAGPFENQDIYLVKPDSSVLRLTHGMMVDGLACSPDGRSIAFSERGERRDIHVLNTDGTGLINLTQGEGDNGLVSWSHDSTRLVFVSEREGNDDIYVVNRDGTGVTRLTTHPAKDVFPMWSPQGETIAFSSDRDGNREIYAVNSDGSGVTNLSNNAAVDDMPVWSPDASMIAFMSNRTHPAFNLFVINADGTDVRRITRAKLFGDLTFNYSWSPDSRLLAFQQQLLSSDTGFDIWLADPDGSQLTPLLHWPEREVRPSWSPDGNWLAFTADRDGDDDLYMVRADGSEVRQITDDSVYEGDYCWCGSGPKTAK